MAAGCWGSLGWSSPGPCWLLCRHCAGLSGWTLLCESLPGAASSQSLLTMFAPVGPVLVYNPEQKMQPGCRLPCPRSRILLGPCFDHRESWACHFVT